MNVLEREIGLMLLPKQKDALLSSQDRDELLFVLDAVVVVADVCLGCCCWLLMLKYCSADDVLRPLYTSDDKFAASQCCAKIEPS